ncbi:MAG: hypothetical protein JOZ81_13325 [Chloroflexi bacterium]|nr:hypothetical protein [Chloroflexota bacterium]
MWRVAHAAEVQEDRRRRFGARDGDHAPGTDADVLDEIWLFIAGESGNREIADRFIDSLGRFLLLATHPHLGRHRDEDLLPGLRSFPVAATCRDHDGFLAPTPYFMRTVARGDAHANRCQPTSLDKETATARSQWRLTAVALVGKGRAKAVGLDSARRYARHPLRAGLATSAAAAGHGRE